ncbi:transcription antitermination factor NusB [Desulfuromonas acetoxidans]|uniref:Transcription antitermination protein NusB n=1 Tax=Desulfuromonas acetoxidans (strain DSM 684 / 11070) TaxID=281689 RepID=Q1K0M4_DESA6|nr:transcription antitermination factor NusB [Desulfuromonas acetoxidans]EAT15917.1 NusB antitermination factor [Desulfuromonas acetoxidans DSM 684]MBF0644185.1 transcription antitermination factor NusB [Desulfuromonas acetoxidans]NVD24517.1 transcription antitermination factor NusB [Desulfuromonas acetoxidans]NVE16533.1 transcription antitermination factor NusB [Desulfuromonas acetoxidans]
MAKGTRRNGREYALKILYSLYDQDAPLDEVLSDFWGNFRFSNDVLGEPEEPQSPLSDDVIFFSEQLVKGVYEHLEEIDAMLLDTSKNWALDRMPRLDLSLMRMACYELIYVDKTPTNVVINEAIEIAKRYGTKDTPAFLNGVLDRIAKRARS